MTDITIPPEAFAAGRDAFYNAEARRKSTDDAIRAAFLAMVKAWPEAKRVKGYFTHDTDYYEPAFILPLPQEKPDGA